MVVKKCMTAESQSDELQMHTAKKKKKPVDAPLRSENLAKTGQPWSFATSSLAKVIFSVLFFLITSVISSIHLYHALSSRNATYCKTSGDLSQHLSFPGMQVVDTFDVYG